MSAGGSSTGSKGASEKLKEGAKFVAEAKALYREVSTGSRELLEEVQEKKSRKVLELTGEMRGDKGEGGRPLRNLKKMQKLSLMLVQAQTAAAQAAESLWGLPW